MQIGNLRGTQDARIAMRRSRRNGIGISVSDHSRSYGEEMRLVAITLGVLYALVVTGLFVWHVLWERWRER